MNNLPKSFILSVEGRTFKMSFRGDRWWGVPQAIGSKNGLTAMMNVIWNGEMYDFPGYITHWTLEGEEEIFSSAVHYYFKGIERDYNHPSPNAYKIVGLNAHFDSDDGITHCGGSCCPVAF